MYILYIYILLFIEHKGDVPAEKKIIELYDHSAFRSI